MVKGARVSEARVVQYELEIEINADCERVWAAIFEETQAWWLPDFHMVGPDSEVTFDSEPGGGLMERRPGGGHLKWYEVHFVQPEEFKVYLVGHIAPDWGGPSTSSLSLQVTECEGGCKLRVTDALCGHVSEQTVDSLSSGWTQLFQEGLKKHVESGGK